MTATRTSSMIAANGNAPAKMSPSETVGSLIALLTVNTDSPSGGVSSPISAPITVMTPNQTRSPPNATTADMNSGDAMRIMDAVSRTVPRIMSVMT